MCCSRQLAIEYRTREGEWGAESGDKEDRSRAARARPSFFVVNLGTPTRAPTHTYSALHTHLFTLNSAENSRTQTSPVRSGDTCRYPVCNPGGRARPRATSICRGPLTQ